MSTDFFDSLLAIMAVSLGATVVLNRFKMPNILAYLLAGCLIGPSVFGWVESPQDFTFLAEFGVVFLLFSLGLEFSIPKLLALRHSVFGLGSIQVSFCCAVFGVAVWWWGTSVEAAIVIAGALALSSTAIVSKELAEMKQVHSRHGQLAIGVLLFQDLAAVVFLILVPVLGGGDEGLWQALGWALLKGLGLMLLLLGLGKTLLPLLYTEVARTKSDEVFVLTTLVIVLMAAWITHSLHLSMALGGFVIGMMLGENQFRHQINSDIRPFKDILLGLFFVTIGMNIDVALLIEYWPRIILFSLGLIVIKAFLIALLVKWQKETRTTALQTGLNLAQAGEFGLALMTLGVMHKLVPADQASFIVLVAIMSMVASPFLIRHSDSLSHFIWRRLGGGKEQDTRSVEVPKKGHVIIGGFGRVGKTLANLLEQNEIDYIAIEQDVDQVSRQRKKDHNVIYGDCTKMAMLSSCHIDTARLAILTFHSMDIAKTSIAHIRSAGIKIPIIVRCAEQGDFNELISLGADAVVPEMLEASLVISAQVLALLQIDDSVIDKQIDVERRRQLTPKADS